MISIVIPTYNRAHLISRAIQSVLGQDYKDWELLIVDDGSTDNTAEVVEDFLENERIRYIRKDNTGATHTRNVGAQYATREFLTFLDSDDEARPNWLSSYYDKIEKGAEVVCCGYEYYDHNGNFLEEKGIKKMGPLYQNYSGRFTNGGTYILKKSFFDDVGGFDENLKSGQHSELALRLTAMFKERGIEIVNIYKPLIKVHVHKGEKIRGNHRAMYEGVTYTLEKHRDLFEQNTETYHIYLSLAGNHAMRIGKFEEGNQLFRRALDLKPRDPKSIGRFFLSKIPIIRERFWKV